MADVKFNRGYFDKLPKDIKPGTISIAEDSQELYIDTSHNNINKRIRITDVIDITGQPKPTILYNNKIYINGNKIQKVLNNELIDISSVGNSVLNVDKDINRDTLTIGTLDGLFGKVGDFIIDSKGNIGIVKELINNKTKVQIVSMIGNEYDNQKIEYFINIGNKVNSKNLGTLEHPYTTLNELQEKLQNSDTKIVLNCVSNFDFGDISNWNNNVINGNDFAISFTKFENNNNVQLNNCKFNTNNINNITECNNISINNIIGKFQFNSCENVKIDEFENYLKFALCNNLYLNNVKSNNAAVNIITEQQSGNVIINDCICNLSMSNSVYNDDVNTNVIIQNSKLNSINIDENVYNIQLMSGVCTDNTGASTIAAKIINLGTFEFFSKPTFGDTSKILDKVGLSSKQVFDEKNRSYINNYINKSNTLTNDDKKVNLEFHLDAIDDSLNNINDSINSLSEEGSGLTEAYISKGTFKTAGELESQTWRTGDVVKFIAKTPIKISKQYNLNIIKLLDITITDQETSEEKKYFDFYFSSNDTLPYFVHYGEIINITLVDGENSTDYELPIYYCDKNNIICRIEQDDVNRFIFTPFDETDTEQINKYTNCLYNHMITLNKDDRLIYINNDWDKLSTFDIGGSGSGLNADLLDGKHATDFVTTTKTVTNMNIDNLTTDGFYDLTTITSAKPLPIFIDSGSGRSLLVKSVKGNSTFNSCHQFLMADGSFDFYVRNYHNGNWSNWNRIISSIDLSNYVEDEELERLQYYGDKDIIPSDSSYFTVNETGETITGLTDTGKTQTELVIPYKINGKEITNLYFRSAPISILNGNNVITKVVIPNSVTSIGSHAFYDCASLTSIIIPNSVTSIGSNAFGGCTSLRSINIPNSVTFIGEYAFHDCTSLTSINIPNSVTSINSSAFGYCTSLTSIEIPNSVTYIEDDVFHVYDDESGSYVPIPGLTIYCEQGSYAETYAKGKNIPIIYVAIKEESLNTDSNADTVDGKHSTDFVYNDTTRYTSVSSLPSQTGIYYIYSSEITGTLATFAITKFYYSSSAYTLQASNCTDGTMYFGSRSGSTITWKKVGAGVEVVTADPTNAATGDIWIRSDLS